MTMVRITVVGRKALNHAAFCNKQAGCGMLATESHTCMSS